MPSAVFGLEVHRRNRTPLGLRVLSSLLVAGAGDQTCFTCLEAQFFRRQYLRDVLTAQMRNETRRFKFGEELREHFARAVKCFFATAVVWMRRSIFWGALPPPPRPPSPSLLHNLHHHHLLLRHLSLNAGTLLFFFLVAANIPSNA